MFMRTYASSRVKRKSFYRKSELEMLDDRWFELHVNIKADLMTDPQSS